MTYECHIIGILSKQYDFLVLHDRQEYGVRAHQEYECRLSPDGNRRAEPLKAGQR
jgi:hypothetical protein